MKKLDSDYLTFSHFLVNYRRQLQSNMAQKSSESVISPTCGEYSPAPPGIKLTLMPIFRQSLPDRQVWNVGCVSFGWKRY